MGIFGGGGGGGGGASSGTQVQIAREAPEVESRKLALYDEAAALAKQPISLPGYQVAGLSPLQQAGMTQAGVTGVGQPTIQAGIAGLQAGLTPIGQQQISQYLNPYQSYVTDEITRQAQIAQNQAAAQAVQAGAFGGGRQGIQAAEIERARQANIGQSLAGGFGTALQAAQQQQAQQLAGGQALLGAGAQQQAMQQADIASLLQAGGIQQQLAQQALEAQRQNVLQQAYEPYQRVEFLKNVMTNLPTSQSALTATTAPGTNPLAQAAGAGLGAYSAYSLLKKKEGGIINKEEVKGNGLGSFKIKKFDVGGFSNRDAAILGLQAASKLIQGRQKPGQNVFESFLSTAGEAVESTIPTAVALAKAEASQSQTVALTPQVVKALNLEGTVQPGDRGTIQIKTINGQVIPVGNPSITSKADDRISKIQKAFSATKIGDTLVALNDLENEITQVYEETGDIPGYGAGAIKPDFLLGQKGKDIRNSAQRLSNITLKDRSGAAVTTPEFERLKKELNDSIGKTDKDFMTALVKYRGFINQKLGLATAGFSNDDLNLFFERGGGEAFKPRESSLTPFIKGIKTTPSTNISYAKDAPMYMIGPGGKLQLKGQ